MKYFLILFLSITTIYSCKPKEQVMKEEVPKEEMKEEVAKEEVVKKELKFEDEVSKAPSLEDLSANERKSYQLIQEEMAASVFAQIRRTPCFGRCPTYTLTVHFSGDVEYNGERNVSKIGRYKTKVEQEVLSKLIRRAEDINFFYLKYFYDNENVTDLPSTITTIRSTKELKTIVSRVGEPNDLRAFNKYFDELFENLDWKKVEEGENE